MTGCVICPPRTAAASVTASHAYRCRMSPTTSYFDVILQMRSCSVKTGWQPSSTGKDSSTSQALEWHVKSPILLSQRPRFCKGFLQTVSFRTHRARHRVDCAPRLGRPTLVPPPSESSRLCDSHKTEVPIRTF